MISSSTPIQSCQFCQYEGFAFDDGWYDDIDKRFFRSGSGQQYHRFPADIRLRFKKIGVAAGVSKLEISESSSESAEYNFRVSLQSQSAQILQVGLPH